MRYKINYSEGLIEFVKNMGRAYLEATDSAHAIRETRELFAHMRDAKAQSLGSGQYLVSFKVSLDYRLPLLRQIEKPIKLLRNEELYSCGRYIDRYIVATLHLETGKPEFLTRYDIKDEITSLRKAAVIARELPNIMSFVDWDICIYNYLELNSREGFKSRVVRKVPG